MALRQQPELWRGARGTNSCAAGLSLVVVGRGGLTPPWLVGAPGTNMAAPARSLVGAGGWLWAAARAGGVRGVNGAAAALRLDCIVNAALPLPLPLPLPLGVAEGGITEALMRTLLIGRCRGGRGQEGVVVMQPAARPWAPWRDAAGGKGWVGGVGCGQCTAGAFTCSALEPSPLEGTLLLQL